MTFYKPIQHDLRCGLLRAEYWLAVFVTSISLLQYFRLLSLHSISGTLGDCLLYLFRGEQAISSLSSGNQKTEIPILWILLIVTCPALHIHYFLDGLTMNGQQIMIRCQSRKHWILSKCVWAMAGGCLYYLMILICAVTSCIIMNQVLSLSMTASIAEDILNTDTVSAKQVLFTAVVKPLIVFQTCNLLQIALQMFIHPIAAFLICFVSILFSLYSPIPWIPFAGAIAVRNIHIPMANIESWISIVSCFIAQLLCISISIWRFSSIDLLRREDT